MSKYHRMFSVSDFESVDIPWGRYRHIVGRIKVHRFKVIFLFREYSDGREWIGVHNPDDENMPIHEFGVQWVKNDREKQEALDNIARMIIDQNRARIGKPL